MKPHKCPVCLGNGHVANNAIAITAPLSKSCPACHGRCVLWEEDATEPTKEEEREFYRRAYSKTKMKPFTAEQANAIDLQINKLWAQDDPMVLCQDINEIKNWIQENTEK